MKRAIYILPVVALLALGCAAAADDGPFHEDVIEHSEELEQVHAPTPPGQQLGPAPLESPTTGADETGRPEPDPWTITDQDPNRPDPDPWTTPQSNTSSGSNSTGTNK
jgi:hypothetical protein